MGTSILSHLVLWKSRVAMSGSHSTPARRKYLVVDDHAGFRAILRTFLPEPSPDVVECSDGSEAVAAYAAHQPDWTLMDIAMPGMDGFSATRAIRSQFPDARIIIVTQADSQDLREEASAAGATAYILKDRLSDVAVVISSLCPPPGCNQI